MSDDEIPEPMLNSPFEEPAWHRNIEECAEPEKRPGRGQAGYSYRDLKTPPADIEHEARRVRIPLQLVNRIRAWLKADVLYAPMVIEAFVSNEGPKFAISYIGNGRPHDFLSDFTPCPRAGSIYDSFFSAKCATKSRCEPAFRGTRPSAYFFSSSIIFRLVAGTVIFFSTSVASNCRSSSS